LIVHGTGFLLHGVAISNDSPCPCKYAFSFTGKALIIVTVALDNQDTEFLFKQADSGGQRWLRDKTGCRSTTEMLFTFQSYQEP